jgi:HSP20 family molecular chaperone IbpA
VDVKEDILYLELDVPGSEVEWSHDPKAKEKITIKGTRNPSDSTRKSIQSNRKMGEWKFIYNVPEGYNPEPVEEATLDDGVFTLKFKKGDLKPVVRKPVKPSKKQN